MQNDRHHPDYLCVYAHNVLQIWRSDVLHVAHLAKVVFCGIPHHRCAGVHPGSVLLHDDACYNVLEGLVERLQLLETVVNDRIGPVCHLFAERSSWDVESNNSNRRFDESCVALNLLICVLLMKAFT